MNTIHATSALVNNVLFIALDVKTVILPSIMRQNQKARKLFLYVPVSK